MEKLDYKVTVVGGPFSQKVDPVLDLVPTGEGLLAALIADELEKHFVNVARIGNFPGGRKCSFGELRLEMFSLKTNVLVFLPHLPNIIIDQSPEKLRAYSNEIGVIPYVRAPKIVESIKQIHPEVLLVPFKLADKDASVVEIVKWMLNIHSALAVYSRLGEPDNYFIIDALGNETAVSKKDLPVKLSLYIVSFVKAIRRRSVKVGEAVPDVKYVNELVDFSRTMQPAFEQLMSEASHVRTDRWPGNFSFRCTHGFLSSRVDEGFIVTKRNVDKTGITQKDFVFVSSALKDGALQFHGGGDMKPSIDAPVHRVIYQELPWVNSIIHGHLHAEGDYVHDEVLPQWPCGAENEGIDITRIAPKENPPELWVVNVDGHGFVVLIRDVNPKNALLKLAGLKFKSKKESK